MWEFTGAWWNSAPRTLTRRRVRFSIEEKIDAWSRVPCWTGVWLPSTGRVTSDSLGGVAASGRGWSSKKLLATGEFDSNKGSDGDDCFWRIPWCD